MALNPFVYWAQTDVTVSVRVDLTGVKNPNVKIEKDALEFEGIGCGSQGEKMYSFQVSLLKEVVPTRSTFTVKERAVEITLRKVEESAWWSTLTNGPKCPWVKVDFDKWKPENSEDLEDFEEQPGSPGGLPSLHDLLKETRGPGPNPIKFRILYLFVYNLFLFIGYLYIVVILALSYIRDKEPALGRAWLHVANSVKLCQTLQLFEILHRLVGYTPGGIIEPILQCGGRFVILYAVIDAEPQLHENYSVYCLFMTWSLVELFRYPYYLFRTVNKEYGILTWLRYTVWIPLYPVGFSTEGFIVLQAIPLFDVSRKMSIDLPNMYNFSFSFPFYLRLFLLFCWFPMFYFLFTHMWRLRRSKLNPNYKKKRA